MWYDSSAAPGGLQKIKITAPPHAYWCTPLVMTACKRDFFLIRLLVLHPHRMACDGRDLKASPAPTPEIGWLPLTSSGCPGPCPLKSWKAAMRSPSSILICWTSLAPSAFYFSQERCSSPLIIFVPISGPASTTPHPPSSGGPRPGHSSPMGPHKGRVKGTIPSFSLLPPLCWCRTRCSWPSGLHQWSTCWQHLTFTNTRAWKPVSMALTKPPQIGFGTIGQKALLIHKLHLPTGHRKCSHTAHSRHISLTSAQRLSNKTTPNPTTTENILHAFNKIYILSWTWKKLLHSSLINSKLLLA